MRTSFRNGTAAGRCWLRWSIVLGFVACLNPRPEELPSGTDVGAPGDPGTSGTGEQTEDMPRTDEPTALPPAYQGAGGSGTDMGGALNEGAAPDGNAAGASGEPDAGLGGDGGMDAGGG